MKKLNGLLYLMSKYNDVFSEEVSYDISIEKLEKIPKTENELLNRVFKIKEENMEEHYTNLIKIDY